MISRRNFIKTSLTLGAALPVLHGMGGVAWAKNPMRVYYFGSPDRVKRTTEVIDVFTAQNPAIQISPEMIGVDYWSKLTTMMASKNLPDILTLEPTRFAEYVRRGIARPLDDLAGGLIRLDALVPSAADMGRVDGKFWGMPLALNTFAMLYDAEIFTEFGMAPPDGGTTWDDFARLCIDLTKAVGKKNFWAVGNGARYQFILTVWMIQRGKTLFDENGRLGFDLEDAKSWYAYWDDLAKNNGCTSGEIQATDNLVIDTNPLTTRNSAIGFAFSNQLLGFQGMAKKPLGIAVIPNWGKGSPSGMYYRPSMHFCISNASKNVEAAARFIDFFVNNVEAGKILGAERGAPVNMNVRDVVLPSLDAAAKVSVDYLSGLADRVGPYPPPFPVGVNEFDWRVVRPVADRLAFRQISVSEAAEQLIAGGKTLFGG